MFDFGVSVTCEICILAGGLSQRMGRDKAQLRVGRGTMLSHIRKTALSAGFPVRIIRRDCVPRCGPIGGIYTGLKSTRADAAIFLACDMPFVRAELIKFLFEENNRSRSALFVRSKGSAGFPLLMQRRHLERVEQQIKRKQLSLQALAKSLRARIVLPPRSWPGQLLNVNTLSDWKDACEMWQLLASY